MKSSGVGERDMVRFKDMAGVGDWKGGRNLFPLCLFMADNSVSPWDEFRKRRRVAGSL